LVISAGDLERIGDKGKRMLDFHDYRRKRGKEFSLQAMQEIRDLFHDARRVLAMALSYIDIENDKAVTREALAELALRIRKAENSLRASHAQRLTDGKCSAESGLVFIDVLGAVEQIAYRSRKIADHMCEKRGE
jgi:phosphate:Na+ symporter